MPLISGRIPWERVLLNNRGSGYFGAFEENVNASKV
jgi:hypothetical protein